MASVKAERIRQKVRERYGKLAAQTEITACGCGAGGGCCGSPSAPEHQSQAMGYNPQEMQSAPLGANLGLGCGNPQAIASLKKGETVLDLGSGAGFDCFLAAGAVGSSGKVIGVDMTAEMVARARENAVKNGEAKYGNVAFRLGEIEHLPVADSSIDVIISNCVINLSAEKEQTFAEAFRVLRPGGRLAISDVVAVAAVPEAMKEDLEAISSCLSGAETVERLESILQRIGFREIRVVALEESRKFIDDFIDLLAPQANAGSFLRSATIEAVKPAVPGLTRAALRLPDRQLSDKDIRSKVTGEFKRGYHCAEAVTKTIMEIFTDDQDMAIVRCSAGLGGGMVGTTEETCGALTGGLISLGSLLGRYKPGDSLEDLGRIGRKFRENFALQFGSTHCGTLRKGFAENDGPLGCVRLSALTAVMLVELINVFEEQKDMSVAAFGLEPRGEKPLGSCPFSVA